MTQFELYLNQFNTTIDASGAQLPDTTYDVSLGLYDVIFETNLSLGADISSENSLSAFEFVRQGDNLIIKQNVMSFAGNGFSVQQSTYLDYGTTLFKYPCWSGANAPHVLVEDYLAYIALIELGNTKLVGAFDNYQTIYDSIDDNVVKSAINAALGQGIAASEPYTIPSFIDNTTVAGDSSPVWNVYSYVLENFTSRLTDAPENVTTNFLQEGDIIDIKVTVSTPALDSSIADASGNPVNGNMSYTPVHPGDRVYLIKIHIIA